MAESRRPRRWIVESVCPLREVLARMGQSCDAAADGRVFVDDVRCGDVDARVAAGSRVDVYPSSDSSAEDVTVLSRRGDLIAVDKPAGLSTIPDQRGAAASLLDVVARLVGERDRTRVHATSRLDRLVSGVVVFALGSGARRVMREAREGGRYCRHYVAIATDRPVPEQGWIDAPIGRGRTPVERRIEGKDAVPAQTAFGVVVSRGPAVMLAAEPKTGRTHQIRVHMAHVGAPLIGDERYGGAKRLVLPSGAVIRPKRIALHAAWVEIALPGDPWRVSSNDPDELVEMWSRCGGEPEDWEHARRPLRNVR